jgi:hypothetical protein
VRAGKIVRADMEISSADQRIRGSKLAGFQQGQQREWLKGGSWARQPTGRDFRVVRGENISGAHVDNNGRTRLATHETGQFGVQIIGVSAIADQDY